MDYKDYENGQYKIYSKTMKIYELVYFESLESRLIQKFINFICNNILAFLYSKRFYKPKFHPVKKENKNYLNLTPAAIFALGKQS